MATSLPCRSDAAKGRVDAASGRILELTGKAAECELWLRFEEGAYERHRTDIEDQAADMADQIDPERLATTLCDFLCVEAQSLLAEWPVESWQKWVAITRKLAKHRLLYPVDRWLLEPRAASIFRPTFNEDTQIPPGLENWVGVMQGLAWIYNDRLFSRGSWWWTLNNEWFVTTFGKDRYLQSTLADLDGADNSGPICHLLLTLLAPSDAAEFAAHGLERLSPDDFRNDYRALLSRETLAGDAICQVAEALRSLDPDEAAAMVETVPRPVPQLFASFHGRLRALQDQPIEAALADALDHCWQSELKDLVEAQLRTIAEKR